MTKNLGKRKPIFKNYIQNNSYILRKETQTKKMHQLKAIEEREAEYLDKLTSKFSGFTGSNKSRAFTLTSDPMSTVQKLIKTSNKDAYKRTLKFDA